ncbi:MAG: DUF1636 domain-containing protein [Oculatellaceae cyanobacterium Prado106]|jgi:predicted metal-binding protein|nr:DUF1636 domain-containing protein [Oculatellaceae cyanobacterium Prado106]
MSQPTLFICKSCHRSSEELPEGAKSDGTALLEQLQTSPELQSLPIQLKAVDCLWDCDRGCVVALASPDKPTYLFSNLPLEESAAALQQFAALYATSKKGHIPWEKFPPLFENIAIAKIPSVSAKDEDDSSPEE